LAIVASFYAVHHGPEGLRAIGMRAHVLAAVLQRGLASLGCTHPREPFFDTVLATLPKPLARAAVTRARERGLLVRAVDARALVETATRADVETLLQVVAQTLGASAPAVDSLLPGLASALPPAHARTSAYLTHPVFHEHRAEHELLRYIKRLEARDLSLTTSM